MGMVSFLATETTPFPSKKSYMIKYYSKPIKIISIIILIAIGYEGRALPSQPQKSHIRNKQLREVHLVETAQPERSSVANSSGKIPHLGLDEIFCSSFELSKVFMKDQKFYHRIIGELGKAPKNNVTILLGEGDNKFEVFTRIKGPHTGWAFKNSDIEKVIEHFGFKQKDHEIQELSSDEVFVSYNNLPNFFIGRAKMLRSSFISQLGDPPEYNATVFLGDGDDQFEVFTRKKGTKINWAFKLNAIKKVAAHFNFKLRGVKITELKSDEITDAGYNLMEFFVGSGGKLRQIFESQLGDPPEYNATVFLGDGDDQFEVFTRKKGVHTRWAFKLNAIKKVAIHFNFKLRGVLKGEIPNVSDDEIAVSVEDLPNFFIGAYKVLNTSFKNQIGDPPEDVVTILLGDGDNQFEVFTRKKGVHTRWAFKEKSKEAVGRFFRLKLRSKPNVLIEELGLEEAIALLGNDPLRLSQYIRIYHPELAQEDVDRIVATSMKGLRAEWQESPEELHSDYEENLSLPEIQAEAPSTESHAVMISGKTAEGITYIQITGAYTRRIAVRQDGTFSATIPLPRTGEINEFEAYGFNPETRQKSKAVLIQVYQTGQKEDTEEVFLRLLALKDELLADIQKDAARYSFLLRSTEQSLLKHFTYNEEEGLEYLRRRLEKESAPAMRAILQSILSKFEKIKDMNFDLKPGKRLWFFQKYCIYETRVLLESGARGVIIANEQGMGKTITALSLINGRQAVVITPNTVVTTWVEQEAEFIPQANLEVLEGTYQERHGALAFLNRPQVVTNIEFTRGMTERRAGLLSRPEGTLVVDEADYLGSLSSQQSRGTRQLKAHHRLLLTATPFKRVSQIGHILGFILPNDPRFSSMRAFSRAFPAGSTESLNALFLLMQQYSLRLRKQDVFEEYDPRLPLTKQDDKLPKKVEISPDEEGRFYLTDEQCRSILELFTDYQGWCRKHKLHASREDTQYYRFKEGYFPKREALRQIMNDPVYIGMPDIDSPKHLEMDRIVEKELVGANERKILIFCRYQAQVEEYLKRYRQYGTCGYYGGLKTDANGYKLDKQGKRLYYKVDEYENFVLDESHNFISTDKAHGRPIKALDYERIQFQNNPATRIMIATYDTGSMGVTLTAADVVVYDDLGQTYKDQYQAGDRAHRPDNSRKKYAVTYYWLQALYPDVFLEEISSDIRREYFDVGTYDQVQYENIRKQGQIFHRIMDGVGGPQEIGNIERRFMRDRMPFMFRDGGIEEEPDTFESDGGQEEEAGASNGVDGKATGRYFRETAASV